VIAPDADIVDLDPVEWAWLSEAVVAARRARHWGYVLHADGVVLSTAGPVTSVAPGDAVTDPAKLARRVVADDPVSRCVVIDRGELRELATLPATQNWSGGALTDYREAVDDAYWASPAVITWPAPPPNPWRELRVAVEAIGEGSVHVLVSADDETVRTSIHLVIAAGVVHRITSVRPGGVAHAAMLVLDLPEHEFLEGLASERMVSAFLDRVRSKEEVA
jgi:hypothetical protein